MTTDEQNQIFLEWVESHGAILWKIARLNAPFGEHRDLYQDLLIALWKAAPLYRGQSKPSTFIYRLAFNRALNWIRDKQTLQRRHVPLDEIAPPSTCGMAHREIQEQRVEELYSAMEQLSDADRSLALMYLEDLSYREMAEVLGITESNVGVKVSRMKKRLTGLLQQTLLQKTRTDAGGGLK